MYSSIKYFFAILLSSMTLSYLHLAVLFFFIRRANVRTNVCPSMENQTFAKGLMFQCLRWYPTVAYSDHESSFYQQPVIQTLALCLVY